MVKKETKSKKQTEEDQKLERLRQRVDLINQTIQSLREGQILTPEILKRKIKRAA